MDSTAEGSECGSSDEEDQNEHQNVELEDTEFAGSDQRLQDNQNQPEMKEARMDTVEEHSGERRSGRLRAQVDRYDPDNPRMEINMARCMMSTEIEPWDADVDWQLMNDLVLETVMDGNGQEWPGAAEEDLPTALRARAARVVRKVKSNQYTKKQT
jgi:translation elongation factor EF-1beta